MASSLIRNDPGHEAISALWRYYRSWLDKEYPETVLISEWCDPAIAIPAGFHIDFLIHFSEPAYSILLGPLSWPDGFSRNPDAFFERADGGDIKAFVDNYRIVRDCYISGNQLPAGAKPLGLWCQLGEHCNIRCIMCWQDHDSPARLSKAQIDQVRDLIQHFALKDVDQP